MAENDDAVVIAACASIIIARVYKRRGKNFNSCNLSMSAIRKITSTDVIKIIRKFK